MAEIVNLRAARKAKDRLKKRAQGAENATKFGRSRAEKDMEAARVDKARTFLDGHARDRDAARDDGGTD